MSRVVVALHGTGRTSSNFGTPQMEAIAEHLGRVPHHRSVWWGDLIDAGARVSRAGTWLIARLHSLAWFFIGRPARFMPRIILSTADVLHRFIDGVAGVIAYLIPSPKQGVIRERLRATLARHDCAF